MFFNVATSLTLALVASSNVGVLASRELQVKLVDVSGLNVVSDLNVVEMPCEGEAAGRKKKCVRPDGKWWGCQEGLVCVMKNHKVGKCLAFDDAVPTDSLAWKEKNKAVMCASRGPESPLVLSSGKTTPPDEGKSCPASDMAQGCECAGARWRCADACGMITKSCDEGLHCLRKTTNAYAICATQEMIDQRGQTDIYDPTPLPCGVNVGTWNIMPGTKEFTPGPMTGKHANRCEDQKKKHMEHGHDVGSPGHAGGEVAPETGGEEPALHEEPAEDDGEDHSGHDHSAEEPAVHEEPAEDDGEDHSGHDHGKKLLSWVQGILGNSNKDVEFWDEEPEWHQEFVAETMSQQ